MSFYERSKIGPKKRTSGTKVVPRFQPQVMCPHGTGRGDGLVVWAHMGQGGGDGLVVWAHMGQGGWVSSMGPHGTRRGGDYNIIIL